MIPIDNLIKHEYPNFSFQDWIQQQSTFNFIVDIQSKLGATVNLYQVTEEKILLHPTLATKLCSDLGDKALVWLAANYYQETQAQIKKLNQQLKVSQRYRPPLVDSVLANFCAG